jgi:hypothetical protein
MKTTSRTTNRTEQYELVAEAQHHLVEAIASLHAYVEVSGDHYTERTILAAIECVTSRDHQWLGRDHNLDDLLESLDDVNEEEAIEEVDEEEQELLMTRHSAGRPALTWRDANPFC